MKIFDRPIQFMPNTPKDGEKLCEKCAGIGWLMSDDETYVVQCRHCYGTGTVTICKHCGSGKRGFCSCAGAEAERRELETVRERSCFEAARKIHLEEAKEYKMFYSDHYHDNEGYFDAKDIYNVMDSYDLGEYVWATEYVSIHIDAADVIANALDDSWDGAIDAIGKKDIEELQKHLNDFCDKANGAGAGTYFADYSTAIVLEKEKRNG